LGNLRGTTRHSAGIVIVLLLISAGSLLILGR
jgi:hypothetical protein